MDAGGEAQVRAEVGQPLLARLQAHRPQGPQEQHRLPLHLPGVARDPTMSR